MDPAVYRVFYPDWRVEQRGAVENVLADPVHRVWVAERDGIPIGFVTVVLRRDDSLGEIYMIAVDPDHQRAGVATALTDIAVGTVSVL